ncbi:MAG TPA: hypothetical protein VFR81_02200 [Longimicrobium sp.]|nr:hypothetical protein [Longimicrobium sp.]
MSQIPEELDGALLSEPALAEDWLRPEEDAAWKHLQTGDSIEDATPEET